MNSDADRKLMVLQIHHRISPEPLVDSLVWEFKCVKQDATEQHCHGSDVTSIGVLYLRLTKPWENMCFQGKIFLFKFSFCSTIT